MELRQLRLFVALAQELNFRKAAERSHIAQPALTRHIQHLEALLGQRLFERNKRRVDLTDAGWLLLKQVRPAIEQIDHAISDIKRLGSGESGDLRIGYISPALYGPVPELLKRFKDAFPKVRVQMQECFSNDQVSSLLSGELDVGFIGRHSLAPGLGFSRLASYPYVLALSDHHPLARQKKIRLEQLDGLTLITPSAREPLHQAFVKRVSDSGATLKVQEAFGVDVVLNFVAAGMGVAFIPAAVCQTRRSGLVYRSLDPTLESLELGITWRNGEPMKFVMELLGLVQFERR